MWPLMLAIYIMVNGHYSCTRSVFLCARASACLYSMCFCTHTHTAQHIILYVPFWLCACAGTRENARMCGGHMSPDTTTTTTKRRNRSECVLCGEDKRSNLHDNMPAIIWQTCVCIWCGVCIMFAYNFPIHALIIRTRGAQASNLCEGNECVVTYCRDRRGLRSNEFEKMACE